MLHAESSDLIESKTAMLKCWRRHGSRRNVVMKGFFKTSFKTSKTRKKGLKSFKITCNPFCVRHGNRL
ncbi:hypothetical protein CAEBREN_07939 [Caenorhabditis brenneri]|uniref:Uncharacterized protein n=1 Tax=Caenorhabditis brenneri TaxID=135651 RepID=G0NDF5_CAEBE|nr:hypothetical protein CAEBREN_07939 [Caenorhabditis brenneri]